MKKSLKKLISVILVLTFVLLSITACKDEGTKKDGVAKDGYGAQITPFEEVNPEKYAEGDIVVSVDGNDSNPGTLKKPIATIEEAQKRLLENKEDKTAVVWLREGLYELNDTINISKDSRANVVYKAYNNEDVVISGGKRVTGWAEETVNGITVWTTTVDETFSALYKENEQLTVARYPDTEALKAKSGDDTDVTSDGYIAFYLDMNQLRADSMTDLVGARVRVYHYCTEVTRQVASFDNSTGKVTMDGRTGLAAGFAVKIFPRDSVILENYLGALSAPGEWYLDQNNKKLYYVPHETDDMEKTSIYYGRLDTMVSLDNTSDITFDGLQFSYSNYDETQLSFSRSQGASHVGGAIEMKSASNVVFRNCNFYGLGQTAILGRTVVKNVKISGCLFQNLGACAVNIVGMQLPTAGAKMAANPSTPDNIVITDNLITEYGTNFNSAAGILIMEGTNIEISHNEIRNGEYTGISTGWVWGYDVQPTDYITIAYNNIHDIGGLLADMGGIYTLGPQEHTLISHNVIYNIVCAENSYGGNGIYNDEGSTGIVSEYNLVFNCTSTCYEMHYGRNCVLRNNIFIAADSGYCIMTEVDHPDPNTKIDIENNLLIANNAADRNERTTIFNIGLVNDQNIYNVDGNIYWDLSWGASSASKRIEEGEPLYAGGISADPKFDRKHIQSEAENPGFMPPEDAKIFEKGFETWDYTEAGYISDIQTILK